LKPPESISPHYDSFPAELRARPIWLVWKYELNAKKTDWTKVPHIAEPGGGGAKSNDPSTWRSFEQAVRIGQKASGIGLCFVEDYCGIDLDCCRDKDTGVIAPWAQKIVDHLHSYTELSPSGTGLHIIVRLTQELPAGGRKWGGKDKGWEIGVYDRTSPRYFCVTGRILEDRSTLRMCDPGEFYPQFAAGDFAPDWAKPKPPEPVTSKPNGQGAIDKKRALLRGEWEGLYPSQSEAEFALVWYLAQEFRNDPAAIDRAVRNSCLMRDKWDEKRSGGTYGSLLIAKIAGKNGRVLESSALETMRPDMSDAVLDGRLGEIFQRHMKGCALAYAWGYLATIAGTAPALKRSEEEQGIRSNLYFGAVGPVGTGKSAIFSRALHALGVPASDPFLLRAQYGSAEGLTNELKNVGSCTRLLFPDELGNLLAKCSIQYSSFPTFLTRIFYDDDNRGGTKKEEWAIDCRLSITGGVVEDKFGEAFSHASVSGLYDRFLLGLCPQPYEYDHYPPAGLARRVEAVPPLIDGDVWEVRDQWKKCGITGRIAENCLRVAYICAAVDARPSLRGRDLGPAQALGEYQVKVRGILQPNPGQNPDAQCAVLVKSWLRQHAQNGEWVKFRDLNRGTHADRLGPGVFIRCLQNLQFCADVKLNQDDKLVRLLDDGVVTTGDKS
jgi:hypothetical protein